MFVAPVWRGKGAALMAAPAEALGAGLMPALSTERFALGDGKGSTSVSELEVRRFASGCFQLGWKRPSCIVTLMYDSGT